MTPSTRWSIHALVSDPALRSAPDDVAQSARLTREAVEDATARVGEMLVDLRAASQSARRTAEQIETLTGPDGLERTLADIQGLTPGLRAAADGLPELVARLTRGSKSLERMMSGGEGDFTALVENLRAISDNVRYLTDNARVYPAQVLFGEPPSRAREDER
jgi:ABC-type transporter Mla subunit MlaD